MKVLQSVQIKPKTKNMNQHFKLLKRSVRILWAFFTLAEGSD